ncbi:MAG: hypothetical protein AB1454_11970 [Candidatus Auribacterota bacterium]
MKFLINKTAIPTRHIIWSAVILCSMAAMFYVFRSWFLDDVYISMRYARNWINGIGLVFNPGEKVEGYTNFLWVCLMALAYWVGTPMELTARLISIVSYLIVFAGLYIMLIKKLHLPITILYLALLAFVLDGDYIAWANSGMETTLFTVLVTVSSLLYLHSRSNHPIFTLFAGTGFILAALTRPEGILWYGTTGLFVLINVILKKDSHALTKLLLYSIPFAVIFIPYITFRYNYYGYPVPNTFYAKVGWSIAQPIRGLKYSAAYLLNRWFVLIPSLIYGWRHRNSHAVRYFFTLGTIYWLYVISVGGDIFPGYRFFVPLLPVLYAALFLFLDSCRNFPYRNTLITAALICILSILAVQMYIRDDYRNLYKDKVSPVGKTIGIWMRKNLPSNTVIALNAVGAIPYFSRLKTIDMLGLTDPYLAHNVQKSGSGWAGHEIGDGNYVLSRQPDIIILTGPWGSRYPLFKADYELYYSEEFHNQYAFFIIPIDDIILHCYVRRESRLVTKLMEHAGKDIMDRLEIKK